ncbi:hypothetical protein [Klebsiella aerogenes]|uniref:hypothetical protein n=1 Tax=Klebsiella aerogenes TaxID=548 RepID=UPI001D0D0A5C|nr:hypothetical protein [Klebsiella aerogenes]
MEAMKGAFLGWESQGLQHEVIVMASCCKKGGGQKGNNCHRQFYTQQYLWYCITVLSRDWVVVAGVEPASIGAMPIAVRAAFRYMTSIFTVAYLLARR